jgi:hypothetical protein
MGRLLLVRVASTSHNQKIEHIVIKTKVKLSTQERSKLIMNCLQCLLQDIKVKLSLCLFFNWAQRHESVLGEWRYSSTHSLTSALDGGKWSASRPGRFTPHRKCPWYPLDRRLSGPQSGSEHGGEEKNSSLHYSRVLKTWKGEFYLFLVALLEVTAHKVYSLHLMLYKLQIDVTVYSRKDLVSRS